MALAALEGVRVVELGGEISAAYCTKLLADLGAEVTKVEPPAGDPARAWGPFPGDRPDVERGGGLFRYLNTNKRSMVCSLDEPAGIAAVRDLVAGADLLVENLGPGALERAGLGPRNLAAAGTPVALVRISPFGQQGPYRDFPTSLLTLQAMAGWVSSRGVPDQDPVQVGGRIPEYVAGSYAACAAMSALRAARERGGTVEVDLSTLECLIGTLAYPMLFAEDLRRLGLPPPESRRGTLPGIVRCRDGWVGINALTGQHWQDICAMMGAEAFAGRQRELACSGPDFAEFLARVQPWLDARTVQEIVELGQAFRIPTAPVGDGRTLLECAQLAQRSFFLDVDGFRMPGFPYRLALTPAALRGEAPRLGEGPAAERATGSRDDLRTDPQAPPAAPIDPAQAGCQAAGSGAVPGGSATASSVQGGCAPARSAPATAAGDHRPFAGLRVIELGNFWAGPYVGLYLGALGADVIKVESVQRPDGFRFVAAFPQDGADWYERSGVWQATNLNKRDLTLDLGREEGRELLRRLIERTDVLIENYSARVIDHFGLGYEQVRAIRPDVIMLRMPGFGLEGPWRDYVGWAMVIEQASGMCSLTGDPDRPLNPGGFLDPVIGMHGALAVQAALEHRRRTEKGQAIELAQLEVGACLTAESVIDWSMNRRLRGGEGNRARDLAPQGVYRCAGERWVALSVRSDDEWRRLVAAIGDPGWAGDPELAGVAGRLARHDEIDATIARWTAQRSPDEVVAELRARGIPAAGLLTAAEMYDDPQLEARGYYQLLEGARSGARRYPGWPMRFSFLSTPHRCGPPGLGQHNEEILAGELGLSATRLVELAEARVIGDRMAP